MIDVETFRRAVARQQQPWLTLKVLADYLEELGDERAEGFRVLGEFEFRPDGPYNLGFGRHWCWWTGRNYYRASRVDRGGDLVPTWWEHLDVEPDQEFTSAKDYPTRWLAYETRWLAYEAAARAWAEMKPGPRRRAVALFRKVQSQQLV